MNNTHVANIPCKDNKYRCWRLVV